MENGYNNRNRGTHNAVSVERPERSLKQVVSVGIRTHTSSSAKINSPVDFVVYLKVLYTILVSIGLLPSPLAFFFFLSVNVIMIPIPVNLFISI